MKIFQEDNTKEKILLVGIDIENKDEIKIESSMDELKELVKAAGGEVVSSVIQKRDKIHPAYFVGKGKAEEISIYCDELCIDTVVFNDELSGAQIRNLEEIIKVKVIDRTNLILDIFAKRATSNEGKLQVELAQLKYRLPRLTGLGIHLSRTGAGIGTRGPGEKKLETDKRHILSRINEIKKQLKNIEKTRSIKRKRRNNSQLPIVSLVGYTNSGKSTLLNTLIKREEDYNSTRQVFSYDMLFATLEATLRKCTLLNGQNFLISDTVGFVSKLPTHLIEAFKGTLEEIKFADVLLHVVDVNNEDLEIQIKTTNSILKELDVLNKPTIMVFNKIDIKENREVIHDFKTHTVFISAKEELNIDLLLESIQKLLPQKFFEVTMLLPYNKSNISSYVFENTKVKQKEYIENGIRIETVLNEVDYNRYNKYIVKK